MLHSFRHPAGERPAVVNEAQLAPGHVPMIDVDR
jgi:hypothetical protein